MESHKRKDRQFIDSRVSRKPMNKFQGKKLPTRLFGNVCNWKIKIQSTLANVFIKKNDKDSSSINTDLSETTLLKSDVDFAYLDEEDCSLSDFDSSSIMLSTDESSLLDKYIDSTHLTNELRKIESLKLKEQALFSVKKSSNT